MAIKTINGPIDVTEAGFIAPHEHIFIDISNSFLSVPSFIPTPLSEIEISTWFCSEITDTFIFPPGFVNLIALEIRFLKIVLIIFKSA